MQAGGAFDDRVKQDLANVIVETPMPLDTDGDVRGLLAMTRGLRVAFVSKSIYCFPG